MKTPNKLTLEELLLTFIALWEQYWNSGALGGPSQKDLEKALTNIKKHLKK